MTGALFLALALTPGQHCYSPRPVYGYYNNYYPQTYYQPAHQAYYPQHQPVYPAQKVIAQDIAVAPLIVTVPVDSKAVPVHAHGSPYYYSASDAYREKAYLREVIREELRALATGNVPQQNTQPVQRQPQQQAQPPVQQNQPVVEQQRLDDETPMEIQTQVLAAYNGTGKCVECHGGSEKASGRRGREFRLVLDTENGPRLAYQPPAKRWEIYGMASAGAMPPAAAKDAAKAMETKFLSIMLQYASYKPQQ